MGAKWGCGEFEGVTIWWGEARLLTYGLKVYVYGVDEVLIDAASWSLRRPFWRFFDKRLPKKVLLTHLHEDHCGNAGELTKRGVQILTPESAIKEARVEPMLPLYRRLIWGRRPAFEAAPLPGIVNTERHALRVVPVPGHTAGDVAFLEEKEGWLFTGDFFLTAKPRLIFRDEDLSVTISSIEDILRLPFRLILDAHEGPLQDGPALFQKKRDYLLELRDRVEALRKEGLSNIEIDRRLFPKKPLITRVSKGEWSSLHMVKTLR